MDRWPHQIYGVEETLGLIAQGERRIVLQSPTGAGKTLMMKDLANHFVNRAKRVSVYTNRKLLVDQIARSLTADGVEFGVRAADHAPNFGALLQLTSVQTEEQRVFKEKRWVPHDEDLAIWDECHTQKGLVVQKMQDRVVERGGAVVGVTATPLDIGDMYDRLVQAGKNSELRACGALVPARQFGCDEPDLRQFRGKIEAGVDLTDRENAKAVMANGVYARVFEWYRRLNPQGKPTILFAPGVDESYWFAREFRHRGVEAAHIDGDQIWMGGQWYDSTRERRDLLLDLSRTGAVKIICNRFVLREGIDAPWLCHGIFATVFGSLQSYLQSGGRLLRSYPGIDHVTVQDHGGNWHRHGSLNADREWDLVLTASIAARMRIDQLTAPGDARPPQPFLCPECKGTLVFREVKAGDFGTCPYCGHEFDFRRRARAVVMSDGVLVEYKGDVYRPRKVRRNPDTQDLWNRMYFRFRNAKKPLSFKQCLAFFVREYGYEPPRTMSLMPAAELDWYRKVKDVPRERLL